ncbi:MAG TPA: hypothetical protein VNC39_17265 [Acidocella sp.]|jgi:hypothetical protein|uniref:hypothetical protein n=1 Tax=Acidocella sp. TaxID=50710 RepID=UPI002C44EC78|nr:hypothetical protein [Acidocella sp.]HVE23721.1 hypothetical protein [Acidocella sp.]
MAEIVMLKHKDTGIVKKGFYGYSWTTFFFGAFVSLFRQDFVTFLGAIAIMIIVGSFTLGIGSWVAMFIWAFMYNKYYTRRLLERGYVFSDSPDRVAKARAALGVTSPSSNPEISAA